MGGVVEDVFSGIGDIGQGAIDAVSDLGASIDDVVNQAGGWTTAALLAAGYYYAPEIGAYVNATTGSTVPLAAVADAGAAEAALTATDLAIGTGGGGAVNAGFSLPVIPPELSAVSTAASVANAVGSSGGAAAVPTAVPAAVSTTIPTAVTPSAVTTTGGVLSSAIPSAVTTAGEMTAQQASEMIAKEQAASTGLLGSAINFAQENIPLTLAGAGLAAKALGGSTPTSSTATTSIDPDVKEAYLRNLQEARMVGAGLGQRQFAPYADYNLGMVQKYMNPYENTVVQNTLADIERARQGQISAEGARATASGAFGGTRQAVTRSLVDEAALRNAGNLAAQLRNTGFAQAQNLGLSQQQMMQQYEQQKLDAARNLGLERLNVAQGALSLQPANIGGSTTTPIYKNTTASALGGALGGATLGKLIGGTANPEYAGYGAGIGGLLGFM